MLRIVINFAVLWGFCFQPAESASGQARLAVQFSEHLDILISIRWQAVPLRASLARLSKTQNICIFLDRRIDPDQRIAIDISNTSLRECLQIIAHQVGGKSCEVGNVVYISLPVIANLLPTVAAIKRQEAGRMTASLREKLLSRSHWSWNNLSTPRELLTELLDEVELAIDGIESIPHDLWPAMDLPATTWSDRLSLLLAGFDLSFTIVDEGERIELTAMPASASLTCNYRVSSMTLNAVEQLRGQYPNVNIVPGSNRLIVTGKWEDLRQVSNALSERKQRVSKRRGREIQVYDLHVEAAVEKLIATVAKQLSLEVDWDVRTLDASKQRIYIEVKQATADELLHAILDPVDLQFRVADGKLHIVPMN